MMYFYYGKATIEVCWNFMFGWLYSMKIINLISISMTRKLFLFRCHGHKGTGYNLYKSLFKTHQIKTPI